MTQWLKQSTAVDIVFGPFLDEADGFTAETGLTITQPDIRLKKNGGNWAQKNAAQTLTHEEDGYYEISLDATDTDTLGRLRISVHEAGSRHVYQDFMVVPANVWDSMFGSDKLQVDVTQIDGQDTSGNNATLNLKKLNIVNNAGDAIVAQSTGSNGSGIKATAHGTGHAIHAAAGATSGSGIYAAGTATSAGLRADGGTVDILAGSTGRIGGDLTGSVASISASGITGIWNKAMAELSSVPSVTGTVLEALSWLFSILRNKRTLNKDTGVETVFKDDGATTLATSSKSDDGTTFTRGEYTS